MFQFRNYYKSIKIIDQDTYRDLLAGPRCIRISNGNLWL